MNITETAKFTERTACINCGATDLEELSKGRFDEGVLQKFIEEDPWGEHPAPFLRGQKWSFVACKNCGLKFHRYILNPEWNERRFSKWMSQEAIEEFEKPLNTPENKFRTAAEYTAHVLQIEQLTRDQRGSQAPKVLDFGCGYGGFLSMCSLYGFDAVGVDRSSAKLNNGIFDKVFPNIEDVVGMGPFHALTLFQVLEHLDEPQKVILQLRELVTDGGILVLETPNCSGVTDIKTRYDYNQIHPLEHINAFTPETMKDFAKRLGFVHIAKPVSIVTCDFNKVRKGVAKYFLKPLLKPTTHLYFRKV